MKLKSQQDIFDRFPLLYQERHLPCTQTCMCWGLDCGQGWYNLIYSLSEELQLLSNQTGYQVIITQLKEKWGHLTVYYRLVMNDGAGDLDPAVLMRIINCLISAAEKVSEHTCDACGTYAERRTTGYILPLCDEHYAEWENEMNNTKETLKND